MSLDLVPCPTCAVSGADNQCPECLGYGCIPVEVLLRELEDWFNPEDWLDWNENNQPI